MTKTKVKEQKTQTLTDQLGSMALLGEVVTLGSRSAGTHKFVDVQTALTESDLDPKAARAFLSSQAFNRACKKLADERVIDILDNNKDTVTFQFSKRHLIRNEAEGEDEFQYLKEVKVVLDKEKGTIHCKDEDIKAQAQAELDRCMEERTTSDITRIVIGLFDKNADLMPIPGAVGVYYVPKEHSPFLLKITCFLERLGRKPFSFPIPAGTQIGDRSVQDTVEEYLKGLLEAHSKAVAGFTLSSRPETIQSAADKINHTRVKIEAYATYLEGKKSDLLELVEKEKKGLLERIESLSKERELIPEDGQGRDKFGSKSGSTPYLINKHITVESKSTQEIATASNVSTVKVKSHLAWLASKGHIKQDGDGKWSYIPSTNGVVKISDTPF